MKITLLLLSTLIVLSFSGLSQDRSLNRNYAPVRTILTDWDQIRGKWLTSSFVAMANNQPIPDRTFPEMLTPFQLFTFVPESSRVRVINLIDSLERVDEDRLGANLERGINLFRMLSMSSLSATTRRSWTFGEPHIVTFDNTYYQNFEVGEFILAKSNLSNFEIQARFETINEDASFTTALSMNVNGDIVSFYANEKPDNIEHSALRINGMSTTISNPTYYLPKGGTITYSNGDYTINWASGETAIVQFKNYLDKKYLNIAIQIRTENETDFTGLSAINSKNSIDEQYDSARINENASIFQYQMNRTAAYYSIAHHKRKKVPNINSESDARNICINTGVYNPDLEGSMYDYVHFSILPSKRPAFTSPNDQIELIQLSEPVLNNNSNAPQIFSNQITTPTEEDKINRPKRENPLKNENFIRVVQIVGSILGSIVNSGVQIR